MSDDHLVAAFRRGLPLPKRLAAQEAYLACAELRGVIAGVCAAGIVASAEGPTRDIDITPQLLERCRSADARLRRLEGLEPDRVAAVLAALADLRRALEGVARAPAGEAYEPWAALLDCYAAMAELRADLWAFELRLEGAPLASSAYELWDDGFVSAAGEPAAVRG